MDADGHIIPIVEDDQGEGYKEVFQAEELNDIMKNFVGERKPDDAEIDWDELLKSNPDK